MMNEGQWHTIAGNRFFVKDGKILYGEKHFLGGVHDLYLYRLDEKTGKYKPIPLKNAIAPSTLRRGLKNKSIKLLPY